MELASGGVRITPISIEQSGDQLMPTHIGFARLPSCCDVAIPSVLLRGWNCHWLTLGGHSWLNQHNLSCVGNRWTTRGNHFHGTSNQLKNHQVLQTLNFQTLILSRVPCLSWMAIFTMRKAFPFKRTSTFAPDEFTIV